MGIKVKKRAIVAILCLLCLKLLLKDLSKVQEDEPSTTIKALELLDGRINVTSPIAENTTAINNLTTTQNSPAPHISATLSTRTGHSQHHERVYQLNPFVKTRILPNVSQNITKTAINKTVFQINETAKARQIKRTREEIAKIRNTTTTSTTTATSSDAHAALARFMDRKESEYASTRARVARACAERSSLVSKEAKMGTAAAPHLGKLKYVGGPFKVALCNIAKVSWQIHSR